MADAPAHSLVNERVVDAELTSEEAEILDAVISSDEAALVADAAERRQLNIAFGATGAIVVVFMLLSAIWGIADELDDEPTGGVDLGNEIPITWKDPIYMPRHEECIDPDNGQDPDYIGYGVGYEPSLSIDSQGNMQVTAHKDLRWGGEDSPIPIFLDPDDPGLWYACESGQQTSWDYWASWFWVSTNEGENWTHGDAFDPTPGNMLQANYLAGGSECLGDEGDIAVDANDIIYYLDTTLEDNWWHKFSEGGATYESGACDRMNTMAADDRPWVAAQGDGIIHYLGNSGAPPPECTLDSGRYWYYHSENGGNSFSQCYSMPGGWSTISSQRNGPYVYVAQEDADSGSGTVQIRISDDYGKGTGPGPSDGSWAAPLEIGPRGGNCPEGYPVVNNNEGGTVAVVWADCPGGDTAPWLMQFAISYDYGENWSQWNATPFERGIAMYPFVSISENDVVSLAFYGLDYDQNGSTDGYTAGKEWYLYAGALQSPQENDSWNFVKADPTPLHVVTDYEESNQDTHALHDFFETVISPDGSWMGIAYQQNIGEHPFEENEEQRYIKFVRGDFSGIFNFDSGDFIDDEGVINSAYSCDSESPALTWSNAPEGTSSFAVTLTDMDAPSFTHWVVWDIAGSKTGLSAGSNGGGETLENGAGSGGYYGPCPPAGETHTYLLTVYAVDSKMDVFDEEYLAAHTLRKASQSGEFSG